VLEKQGSGRSGITGVHIYGRPVLGRAQEDFSEMPILEAAGPGRIPDAIVLEVQHFMTAPIWEAQASRRELARALRFGHA
jgi:hypothetical protein